MLTFAKPTPGTQAPIDQMQVTVMRAELAALIERHTGKDGAHASAYGHLSFARTTQVHHPAHSICEPSFCILAQGSKRVLLGAETYIYDNNQYLVASQNLPVSSQVIDASPEAPYLGLRLSFGVKEIADVALEFGLVNAGPRGTPQRGIFTGALSATLLEPVLRLMKLLDSPEDVPALAPLISREILYRLLKSPDGWKLTQMAVKDGYSQRVTHAIGLLTQRFREPLRMEDLAASVHMSVSSLHHHFKAVTSMSPLQFQKQLRLQESRRIMMVERLDAATAGHRVGYESQSQFNREYSRFFGMPPLRDIKRLREMQVEQPGMLPDPGR